MPIVNLSITDERIIELSRTIKPLIMRDDKLYYIEECNPRNVSFIWDPVLLGEANDIEPFIEINTYHTYGYYGVFKPSIAEVLSHIPVGYIEKTCAFSVKGPVSAECLNEQIAIINVGYHSAVTTLYCKKG